MYNNDYMYAIERSPEFLAHYGIRGMKWGVRKAIQSGNSAKLSRQYAKASKKLAKLEKRAANSKKYARRAALMGAGAAAAGGLAAAGTRGVGIGIAKAGGALAGASRGLGSGMVRGANAVQGFMGRRGKGKITSGVTGAISRAGHSLESAGAVGKNAGGIVRGAADVSGKVMRWGDSNTIGQGLKVAGRKLQNAVPGNVTAKLTGGKGVVSTTDKLAKVSNNTFARIGAGAVGAGLAVGAARNAYKAATAKKKAEKFRSAMNESFKGTKYANGGNRQGKRRRR